MPEQVPAFGGKIVDGVEVHWPPLRGDHQMPPSERHPVHPDLVAALDELGKPYGPMGVALAAARLAEPAVLRRLLTGETPRGEIESSDEGVPRPVGADGLGDMLARAAGDLLAGLRSGDQSGVPALERAVKSWWSPELGAASPDHDPLTVPGRVLWRGPGFVVKATGRGGFEVLSEIAVTGTEVDR